MEFYAAAELQHEQEDVQPVLTLMNGRCEIDLREDALLGHGSFSVVRKAQLDGHRSCAVKSYHSLTSDGFEDEDAYDQFQAEVNMLSRFDNAAPIVCLLAHASEELGGGLHLVLELGERTLEEHILQQHNGALSVRDVREIGFQLTAALAHLEWFDLVALDFKPSNVMAFASTAHTSTALTWKLIDADSFLAVGTLVYAEEASVTPLYCPPELAAVYCVARHVRLPACSHCWNLGLVLLETLTGQAAFASKYQLLREADGEDNDGIVTSYFEWLAPPASEAHELLEVAIDAARPPRDLRALLATLLATDWSRRSSASEAMVHPFFPPPDSPLAAAALHVLNRCCVSHGHGSFVSCMAIRPR